MSPAIDTGVGVREPSSEASLALVRGLRHDVAVAAESLAHAERYVVPISSGEVAGSGDGPTGRQSARRAQFAAAHHVLADAEARIDRGSANPLETSRLVATVRADLRRVALHEAAALRLAT